MSQSKQIIQEICKINPLQPTAPAAALMAIRARMERKAGISNRIGRMFDGNRGVLFVGKAGVGKTRFLKKIYNGLHLYAHKDGRPLGKWLPSTGGSSGVGMYEVLETHYDSIILADELSLDTPMHVHVMKQIANGALCRPRHRQIDEILFRGLLIGATNAIRLPSSKLSLEHLLATLDRFMVVKVRTPQRTALETLDIVLNGDGEEEPDWSLLAQALTRKNSDNLTEFEMDWLRETWREKSREILDPTRAQFRNSHTAVDILLFIKRFLGIPQITRDSWATRLAWDMIQDCIPFNPVHILWLTPLEEVIYNTIAEEESVAMADILLAVQKAGMSFSRQHITAVLNRMIENYVVRRTSHGNYSTKLDPEVVPENDSESDATVDESVAELTNLL